MSIYTATTTMTTIECGECGQIFALSNEFIDRRQNDHKNWYCPNGCRRYYPEESDKEKLRRRLSEAQEEVNRERTWRHEAEDETETTKKQRNALKGHLGRAKKRAAAGTCPCCKRTFQSLSTHMLKQHPTYVKKHQAKKS